MKYILLLVPPIATILPLAPDASPVTTSSVERVPIKLVKSTLGIVLSADIVSPFASYIAFILNTSPHPSAILASSTLYPYPSPIEFSCVKPLTPVTTLLFTLRIFILSVVFPLAVLSEALTVAIRE